MFLFYSGIAGYISLDWVFSVIGVYTNVQPTTSPGGMLLELYSYHMISTASQYATGNQWRMLW